LPTNDEATRQVPIRFSVSGAGVFPHSGAFFFALRWRIAHPLRDQLRADGATRHAAVLSQAAQSHE
jgi:hypothetical protein